MGLVSDFYKGQTVLLTGGSGFVGKVVLCRLLQQDSCRKIYLLLRPSRGVSAAARLHDTILKSDVFEGLRKEKGSGFSSFVSSRVAAVQGDLLSPTLGLSAAAAAALQQEVSVILHIAASVHFNSPLKENYNSNVLGTLHTLNFARRCANLQVFIHTSTCYVNSDKTGTVEEKIIPLHWNPQDLHLAVRRFIDIVDKVYAL